MDYIETEFDVEPELIPNRRIDSKWVFKQHILDN
ncbi:phage protein [Streptococcus pyogenes]|nr:phage protein [Streptococcus pyogenes]